MTPRAGELVIRYACAAGQYGPVLSEKLVWRQSHQSTQGFSGDGWRRRRSVFETAQSGSSARIWRSRRCLKATRDDAAEDQIATKAPKPQLAIQIAPRPQSAVKMQSSVKPTTTDCQNAPLHPSVIANLHQAVKLSPPEDENGSVATSRLSPCISTIAVN